ncbi:MAG: hypothetical protein AAF086_03560 [Planctomycetota bacterium]
MLSASTHRIVQPAPGGASKTGDYAATRVIRTAEGYPLDVPAGWALTAAAGRCDVNPAGQSRG